MAKQVSLFPEFVEKYFGRVIGKITEKYNGEKTKPTLLYKSVGVLPNSTMSSWLPM